MVDKKPDISLEDAIQKTKDAGFSINFEKGQTVAEDIFALKQDITSARSQIRTVHWIITAFVVALLIAVFLMLGDYLQFVCRAYKEFDVTIKSQQIDHKMLQDIKTELHSLKESLKTNKTVPKLSR